MSTPFAVLGLPQSASTEEVKEQYRSLAKKHHPDVNPGQPGSADKFKRITAAYTQALLTSSKREAAYSRGRTGADGSSPRTSSARPGRSGPARPVDPKHFDVPEWESAHYGSGRTQSQFVRNVAREHRMRQAAEAARHAATGGGGGSQSFGVVLAAAAAVAFVWSLVYKSSHKEIGAAYTYRGRR